MDPLTRLGGRKALNGYVAVALFAAALFTGHLDGVTFVLATLGALGITNGTIAWEDRARAAAGASPLVAAAVALATAEPAPTTEPEVSA